MPDDVRDAFAERGAAWSEERVPGSAALLERHGIALPDTVEQHDLSEAARVLGWRPQHDFPEFLRDLQRRDAAGEDVASLWAPGGLPD